MKTLYYYEGIYSLDVDNVKEFIASTTHYVGEENLMMLFENEIGIIDCLNELEQYCYEFGYDYDDLLELVKE